jgi:glucose/arabinose dehydrogenase
VEIVASNLQAPWSIVFAPDQRLFFSERPGWVRIVQNGHVNSEPALLLTDVAPSVKMGLLGLALDPGFSSNQFVFLAYNYDLGGERYRMRIVRYREKAGQFIDPVTLLENIPAYRNHTGGRLLFGPDGCLYITTGDANDPPRAQRLDSLAGKILRLKPDGAIPKDNPFVHQTNAHHAVWSYGHRNPQGLAFQPGTGDLYAPEHGPDHGDEINKVDRGANYGWPAIHHRASREGMREPLLEFTPAIGPAAALFYQGSAFPELQGSLLVGCLRGEGIMRVSFADGRPGKIDRLLFKQYGRIREVTEGPNGYVYFTTSQNDPPEGTPRPGYDYILRLVPESAPGKGAPLAAEWTGPQTIDPVLNPGSTNALGLIATFCAPCHGPGLRGGMQKGLLQGNWQFAKDDESLRRVIQRGLAEKGMPAFEGALNSAQVASLMRYLQENQEAAKAP